MSEDTRFRRGINLVGIYNQRPKTDLLMLTNEEIAKVTKKYSLDGFLKRHPSSVVTISLSELETECRALDEWEPRDSMYQGLDVPGARMVGRSSEAG
jgi:hypothetical protein